jgi:hypothetical protein
VSARGYATEAALIGALTVLAWAASGPAAEARAAQSAAAPQDRTAQAEVADASGAAPVEAPPLGSAEFRAAMPRLPLAALLGMALALRPKRKGTPTRTPTVVQTQIILAVVGALIMLVVGASLARAFGIVGAANLIRYRSKIEDPKDAGVMLCCLAVGLAAGVGQYALAVFSTAFLLVALAIIESVEPNRAAPFVLKVAGSDDVPSLRPGLERLLERNGIEYALRVTSNEELAYDVHVPFEVDTDQVTNAVLRLGKEGALAVTWDQKKSR